MSSTNSFKTFSTFDTVCTFIEQFNILKSLLLITFHFEDREKQNKEFQQTVADQRATQKLLQAVIRMIILTLLLLLLMLLSISLLLLLLLL